MVDLFIARDIETIRSQQRQIEEEEKAVESGNKVEEESKPVANQGEEGEW